MTINTTTEGSKLNIALEGRLDTSTSPELEGKIGEVLTADITSLEFNFAELQYISSAGLRVLLGAQKTMNKQGSMVIKNVNETIMEVFEVTGFVDILTVE